MLTVYGIANCDTIKKTKKWLELNSLEFTFHDYKILGCDATLSAKLVKTFPIDQLINKRGTTWRKLSAEEQQNLDAQSALALIQRETSIIKRPIIHSGDRWLIGYDEAALASLNNQ
ncbi:MAG: Spx/MgsR family RNA polymerase-binding regulatory protein [Pseudomonadales bacterium]|nr:Spx/MgsR family RNA polymerase-binding regulatory protein [Pseudomonadales bacterium]